MKFVALVVTEGAMPAEAIAEMNRDWPAYAEEIKRHGGLRFGRELQLPEAGLATVRVRDGETLVTDGPFVETKEFVAGIEVLESADLDEVIAIELRNPVARFNPFELRPLPDEFRLGPGVSAFADGDDSDGTPYLMTIWADAASAGTGDGTAQVQATCDCWRDETDGFVLGGPIGVPEAATTLRPHNGGTEASAGPFLDIEESLIGIEVVRAADLSAAVSLAASHPLANSHAIEVRPFYGEAG